MAKININLPEPLRKLYEELKGIKELAEIALKMSDQETMHFAELRRIEIEDQILFLN